MPRSVRLHADDLLASIGRAGEQDEIADRILDAAAEMFATVGIRRCSVDDIAERSGLGRTTVYRRFDGRQQIVEAVLAREVHRFFGSILQSTAHLDRFEDVVVESFLTGLTGTEASLLTTLARSEPELLQLLTIDGAPVVDAARSFLVAAYRTAHGHHHPGGLPDGVSVESVALVAETLVRLAISLVLSPETVLPLGDPEAARAALHRFLDPITAPLA